MIKPVDIILEYRSKRYKTKYLFVNKIKTNRELSQIEQKVKVCVKVFYKQRISRDLLFSNTSFVRERKQVYYAKNKFEIVISLSKLFGRFGPRFE